MTTPNESNLTAQFRDLLQKTGTVRHSASPKTRHYHRSLTFLIGDDGESIGDFLTTLVTSAVHDEQPRYNLKDIYSAVTNSGVVQELVRLFDTSTLFVRINPVYS